MNIYYIYLKLHVYGTDCFFISNYYFYLTTEAELAFSKVVFCLDCGNAAFC